MPALSPGDVFAGYRIAGVGGTSPVAVSYGATEIAAGRPVTLKLLAEDLDEHTRERCLRAARAVAALAHPNVVPVLAVGNEGGQAFVALGHVAGSHLGALLKEEGQPPPERAVEIVDAVASALDAAHARGLAHGSVSAQTVLVARNGGVFVTDFGFARAGDPSDDVQGLGRLLFELLTGMEPRFEAPPPAFTERAPALDAVLIRALAEDRDQRFASAGELARAAAGALDRRAQAETRAGAVTVVRGRPGAPLGGILAPTEPLGPRKVRPEDQPTVPRPVVEPPPS